MRRSLRIRAAGFLLAVAALGSSAPALAQGQGREAELSRLERARFSAPFAAAKDAPDLRRRLHALKADAIPFLFRALDEGRVRTEAEREVALGEDERAVVHETLLALPRRELVAHFDRLATPETPARTRVSALRVLAGAGSGENFKLLARLALPTERRASVTWDLRRAFEEASSAILARDPAALHLARAFLLESPPALSSSIVEALGRVSDPEGSTILASLLGHSPGLDPLILARLGERGVCGRSSIDEEVRAAVRGYLARRESALVGAAAHACAELEDDEAVGTLVDLVDHPDAFVRGNVFRALQRISGLAYGEDPERWEGWYAAEVEWWEVESVEVLRLIELGEGVEFTRAAKDALQRRLHQDRLAESFARGLARRDAEHVVLCCRALGQLGSSAVLEGLIQCLERREPEVRDAALEALRAITGLDHGPEISVWQEVAG